MTMLSRDQLVSFRKSAEKRHVEAKTYEAGIVRDLADTALGLNTDNAALHKANVTLNGLYEQAIAALRTAEARIERLEKSARAFLDHAPVNESGINGVYFVHLERLRTALLSEPQEGEGGTPDIISTPLGPDATPEEVEAWIATRPTPPPASPRLCRDHADGITHWYFGDVCPQLASPPAERHSVFEPRDMKATIERGEWTPPTSPPTSPNDTLSTSVHRPTAPHASPERMSTHNAVETAIAKSKDKSTRWVEGRERPTSPPAEHAHDWRCWSSEGCTPIFARRPSDAPTSPLASLCDYALGDPCSCGLHPAPTSPSAPEKCGSFGCVLPKGHNMGRADVPANHQTSPPASHQAACQVWQAEGRGGCICAPTSPPAPPEHICDVCGQRIPDDMTAVWVRNGPPRHIYCDNAPTPPPACPERDSTANTTHNRKRAMLREGERMACGCPPTSPPAEPTR